VWEWLIPTDEPKKGGFPCSPERKRIREETRGGRKSATSSASKGEGGASIAKEKTGYNKFRI